LRTMTVIGPPSFPATWRSSLGLPFAECQSKHSSAGGSLPASSPAFNRSR
jgi:hypothetical protein